MALSGIQIYKLLPASSKNAEVKQHANCKECGFPTCLAFAMKLGQKQAELSQCPYVEDEAKAQLEASAAPPIRLITISRTGISWKLGTKRFFFATKRAFSTNLAFSSGSRITSPMRPKWLRRSVNMKWIMSAWDYAWTD